MDARLLQPQARRILAVHTAEDGVQVLMTSEHRPVQVIINDDANYVGLSCSR
jgi:hypothetical protein